MKIIINKNENYEVEVPNEIQGKEFLDLIEKLMKLSKFIQISSFDIRDNSTNKNIQLNKISTRKPHSSYPQRKKYFNDKNCALDILQYFYQGSRRDKFRVMKLCEFDKMSEFGKRMFSLKIRHNIQPQEIGFISYSTLLDKNGIREENYIIKSYTGIFDEKEENSDEENGN